MLPSIVDFDREARSLAPNLNLLVLHQAQVIGHLLHGLRTPHTLAAEPLLDLLVQLSKDLRDDFYAHFNDVFAVLARVVSPADRGQVSSAVLGQAFNALVHCFKYLRAHLLKDLDAFFACVAARRCPAPPCGPVAA